VKHIYFHPSKDKQAVLMSYRCYRCKGFKEGVQLKRITEVRPRKYVKPSGGTAKGWEIVKEVGVCPTCHAKYHPIELFGKTVVE